MSTKTTFKRVALVAVAALGLGMLSVATPANAAVSQSLVASVGPNGETSVTLIGADSNTAGVLVRLDVTSNDSSTVGLQANESITATVTGVPSSVTAKTLAANGGSMVDTTTSWSSTAGRSDFSIIETRGQSTGVVGSATGSSYGTTNWASFATLAGDATYNDSTAAGTAAAALVGGNGTNADAVIGSTNTGFVNMDSNQATTVAGNLVKSYYVTIRPRTGAAVVDQGAYTIQFQLTDANQVVRGTKTVKIDFVSSAAKSDAVITLTQAGSFMKGGTILPYDTQTAANAGASLKVTLKNRDGGLIRTHTGGVSKPTVVIQTSATGATAMTDSTTVTVDDNGTYGQDWGSDEDGYGAGSIHGQDGVFGARFTVPQNATSTTAGALRSYQFWAAYGNATIVTSALTVYDSTTTASYTNTDVILDAAGMTAADQLLSTSDADGLKTWTVPTSTTKGTFKFNIQTSSDTAVAAADITVTPTWSGTYGTSNVTPATSTTGTVYSTDATGLVTVSFTNSAPVAGATLTLALTGAKAWGNNRYVATVVWATPAAATIAIADPLSGVYVLTASTNVTTVVVKDQFGNPFAGQGVSVSVAVTPAPAVASTTVISPLTTGANGTATYSLTGGAASTKEIITFTCVAPACTTTASAAMTYNYVATVPAVATMVAYHGYSHQTAGETLVPATGIYQSGTTTELVLRSGRNLSKSLLTFADSTADDMINLRFYALAAGSVAATGAVVTVTAGDGGHILDSSGLPVKSKNVLVGTTGYTTAIQVLATKTGAITFTATSGTVTSTASIWVANATGDARFVKITSAATGTANGSGTPVTVTVTDRYGNAVSGVDLNVVASGVGSFMGGNITQSFTTDAAGTYTFLANTTVSEGGVAKFTATSGEASTSMADAAGYVGTTEVDATLAAGNSSASTSITFAAGASVSDVAQTATDAAAEATDAANAATDAANAAAEAADAATAAAQDAADAVAALSAQVATLISGLKSQLTALTNLVIKIQKKVKA
jgi:hypothetical protein